jgi:hypothetical protein
MHGTVRANGVRVLRTQLLLGKTGYWVQDNVWGAHTQLGTKDAIVACGIFMI